MELSGKEKSTKVEGSYEKVPPDLYAKFNMGHFVINVKALHDFMKINSLLTDSDKVLDFGCGTGETPNAVALGAIAGVGKPGKVVGLDISSSMIQHCESRYSVPSLSFCQLDSANKDDQTFLNSNRGEFSLVTSFTALHWVQDQQKTVRFINQLLKTGGRFLFVIYSKVEDSDVISREFEAMKRTDKWKAVLENKTRGPDTGLRVKSVETSWMTSFGEDGYAHITTEDYSRLMTSLGFMVDKVKYISGEYSFPVEFAKGFEGVLTFPKLEEKELQAEFEADYMDRVYNTLREEAVDGFCTTKSKSILIMGKKVTDVEY